MPQIEGDKRLRRTVKIYGVEGDTVITITASGIEFKAKGAKYGVVSTWPDLVKTAAEPDTAPSRFHRDPYAYLVWQAEQISKRRTKRLRKKIEKEIKERSH